MGQLFTNRAETVLAAALTNVATTLSVTPGTGDEFPSIAVVGADYFLLTLFKITNGVEASHEIVKVTVRAPGTPDTMTIVRAQEGTTALAFASGDRAELRLTKGTLENKSDIAHVHAASAVTYAGNTNLVATNVEAALDELDAEKAALAGSAAQSFSMLNGTVAGKLSTAGSIESTYGTAGTTSLNLALKTPRSFTSAADGELLTFLASNGTLGTHDFGAIFFGNNTSTANGGAASAEFRIGGAASTGGYGSSAAFLNAEATSPAGAVNVSLLTLGTPRLTINSTGAVTIPGTLSLTGASSTLGYGIGAGGTVTQATSKSTAVTLNKPCGRILMHDAALAAGASVVFEMNNTLVAQADIVVAHIEYGAANYIAQVTAVRAGVVSLRVTNTFTGSLSEAVRINFAIIKGSYS